MLQHEHEQACEGMLGPTLAWRGLAAALRALDNLVVSIWAPAQSACPAGSWSKECHTCDDGTHQRGVHAQPPGEKGLGEQVTACEAHSRQCCDRVGHA